MKIEKSKTPPKHQPDIDGGWAWMVLAAVTVWNFIMGGTIKSYGLLYVEFIEIFGSTPTEAGVIGFMFGIVAMAISPISGRLSDSYSARLMAIIGGVVACTGIVLTGYSVNVWMAVVCFGGIFGGAVGVVDGPILAILGKYFHRRRTFANGIAFAGSSFGALVMAPMISLLVDVYSIRGALLLVGGLWLNICVAGAVLRPLNDKKRSVSFVPPKINKNIDESMANKSLSTNHISIENLELNVEIQSDTGINDEDDTDGNVHDKLDDTNHLSVENPELKNEFQSNTWINYENKVNIEKFDDTGENIIVEYSSVTDVNRNVLENITLQPIKSKMAHSYSVNDSRLYQQNISSPQQDGKDTTSELNIPKTYVLQNNRINAVKNELNFFHISKEENSAHSTLTSSLPSCLHQHHLVANSEPTRLSDIQVNRRESLRNRSSPPVFNSTLSIPNLLYRGESICDLTRLQRMKKLRCEQQKEVQNQIEAKEMTYLKFLSNPLLLRELFILGCGFYAYYTPIVSLPAYAYEIDINKFQVAWIVGIIGMIEVPSRICLSYMTDRFHLHPASCLTISFFVTGVCGQAFIMVPNHGTMIAYACIHGIFGGLPMVLMSSVMAECVGIEHLGSAMGLAVMQMNLSVSLSSSTAGAMKQITGSYGNVYRLSSAIYLLGALLYCISPNGFFKDPFECCKTRKEKSSPPSKV